MEIDWGRLQTFRTSKEDAFEELCCQLAENEAPDGCVSFVRKGTPDAGIECYWSLADGSEIGWQAKFHRDSLDDKRWDGIESSFKTALKNHPALIKYIVCLPRNLSDSRSSKTEQDRYDDKVSKWQKLAEDVGRTVTIELWNESQLTRRLSRPENRGTLWFWFGTPSFTKDWFKQHVRDATTNANAQGRYDKTLNLENSEIIYFDAISRNTCFWRSIAEQFQELGDDRLEGLDLGLRAGLFLAVARWLFVAEDLG